MSVVNYDEDLFEFFSKLIDDPEELNLLKAIMSNVNSDVIIDNYINSHKGQKDD